MARIRSIKPQFFRHRRLYLGEVETSLPLRVAFAGLWTCADREGRFRWEPEELKLDCLPFDQIDFSRVLDALLTRGFVIHYVCGDREYGVIPGFKSHQVINNREASSEIPEPPKENDASSTRASRVKDLSKGKGREGKGTGKEGEGKESIRADALDDDWPSDHGDLFWKAYPRKTEKLSAMKKLETLRKSKIVTFADLMAGVERYAASVRSTEMQFIKQPAAWLNAGRWSDEAAALVRSTGPPRNGLQGFESLLMPEGNSDADTNPRSEYDIDLTADSAH